MRNNKNFLSRKYFLSRNEGAKERRSKGAKEQRSEGAKEQRSKGAKEQRAKEQNNKSNKQIVESKEPITKSRDMNNEQS